MPHGERFPKDVDPPRGVAPDRDEHTRDEQQREDRRVHHGGRSVGVRDHGCEREPQRREAPRTDKDHHEGLHQRDAPGDRRVIEGRAERRADRHQDHGHQDRVGHPRGQVVVTRKRCPPGALQDPRIPLEGHADREVGVAGGDDGEGRHPGDVIRGLIEGQPVEDHGAAAEQRGEDHEEHQREREREERRLRVPPERPVRVPHLTGGERDVVHVPTSDPVSWR